MRHHTEINVSEESKAIMSTLCEAYTKTLWTKAEDRMEQLIIILPDQSVAMSAIRKPSPNFADFKFASTKFTATEVREIASHKGSSLQFIGRYAIPSIS